MRGPLRSGQHAGDRTGARAGARGAGGWLNTGGQALTLAGLRGRFVLLDFWTFCCINCLHVLDELRPSRRSTPTCWSSSACTHPSSSTRPTRRSLAAAVERYEVRHPVLDDPELVTWRQYAVRAWPTLVAGRP